MHKHICQCCKIEWSCSSEQPYWDQEDSDCRWYTYVTCPSCTLQDIKKKGKVKIFKSGGFHEWARRPSKG